MILSLFRKEPKAEPILDLYGRVADASRAPWLYLDARVPDTVEGRIESLTLHALLVMRRLKALPPPASDAAQEFIDTLFAHIDHGLRELGVGDVGMPKRMKKIARSFYGRVQAYADPLDAADIDGLAEAFERNIPGADGPRLARHARASEARLAALGFEEVLASTDLFANAADSA